MKILIITGVICAIIMLMIYAKSSHPIKSAFKGMFFGAIALVLISIYGNKFGVNLPLSYFNTAVSLVLGIPGVAILIIGQFILV